MDHAGGAAELKVRTGVPIEGPHKDDQFWIDRIQQTGEMYGVPEARIFVTDRWLKDGDTVTLGETEFEVLHCPGHTPGHVVFFHREARFAQVGDVLFQGSIGRTDFPLGNHQDLLDAITQKLWPLGEDVRSCPAMARCRPSGPSGATTPSSATAIAAMQASRATPTRLRRTTRR
jgi:hydroxyacylglutathione hydrolase